MLCVCLSTVNIRSATDLGYLCCGGSADGLGGDGLGTQQHSRVLLYQAVHWLWKKHLLSIIQECVNTFKPIQFTPFELLFTVYYLLMVLSISF